MSNDLGLDFGQKHSGYRLSYAQMFNWGTFDRHIVTMEVGGKNALLTGSNGSGKTTLVDALLTLLVPSQFRTYNLSSGIEGKTGRNEESYVLGAYSTSKDEDAYAATHRCLRDQSCHSILLACFTNTTATTPLTLMQIRYFSTQGILQRKYFLIEGSMTIEMIKKKDAGYKPGTNWIDNFRNTFRELNIFVYDTFKAYCNDFSRRFGFRSSEKALRILGQTVGMKDLMDLNDFIRTKMLDEEDIGSNFNSILENYQNLIGLKDTIDKEEYQIKQLKEINRFGKIYLKADEHYKALQFRRDTVALVWQAKAKVELCQQKLQKEEEQQRRDIAKQITIEESQERIKKEIESIQATLASDERETQINNLKATRYEKNRRLEDSIRPNRHSYEDWAKKTSLQIPQDFDSFQANKKEACAQKEKLSTQIAESEIEKQDFIVQRAKLQEVLGKIEQRLQALQMRKSNMSLEYLQLREQLAADTGLELNQLPYLGELVQVAASCPYNRTAIESIIAPLAHILLISKENLPKIIGWLEKHNLEEAVEVCTVRQDSKGPSAIRISKEEIEDKEAITLNQLLETKADCPFRKDLQKLLKSKLHLVLAEDPVFLYEGNDKFTADGLVHQGQTYGKGITSEEKDIHITGWDIEEKKSRLVASSEELNRQIADINRQYELLQNRLLAQQSRQEAFSRILEFVDYKQIDCNEIETEIATLDSQIEALLEETKDLESLRKKIEERREKEQELGNERDKLLKSLGRLEDSILQHRQIAEDNRHILEEKKAGSLQDAIAELVTAYMLPQQFQEFPTLKDCYDSLEKNINSQIDSVTREQSEARGKTVGLMGEFKKPKEQRFSTWVSDVNDLVVEIGALPAYQAMLDRLQKEDLPKYKEQFGRMQADKVKKDIQDLNICLNNWEKKIARNISELNDSLSDITYAKNPSTRIQLVMSTARDKDIKEFKSLLSKALPDVGIGANTDASAAERANTLFLEAVQALVDRLKNDALFRNKVLDVRRWHDFAAEETDIQTGKQIRFYQDSEGISGGQKAKLAYTIMAAAIAHQFDVFDFDNETKSFRFVIVDEAFSKSDDENSRYAMNLFAKMDLQLMVVTPMDKVNLVEPFIENVQVAVCDDGKHSYLHNISKETLENAKQGQT